MKHEMQGRTIKNPFSDLLNCGIKTPIYWPATTGGGKGINFSQVEHLLSKTSTAEREDKTSIC